MFWLFPALREKVLIIIIIIIIITAVMLIMIIVYIILLTNIYSNRKWDSNYIISIKIVAITVNYS